jgi:FlaA1/EpsC-like NDP-sugar epimerase
MIKILIVLLFVWFAVRQIRWFLNKPDFKGKTVLITGGSSGIGESLCYEMLKLGASEIIIAARRTKEL